MNVIGIDVGGTEKGFHAVFLKDGRFEATFKSACPAVIVEWCLGRRAGVVAVDAPSGWSQGCSSRKAEQELKLEGKKINCFATLRLAVARDHKKGFYDWMFNGEELYKELRNNGYKNFDGRGREGRICFETFPHAVVCALKGKVVPARSKTESKRSKRLSILREQGYKDSLKLLTSIDFIDAALCAVTAQRFREGRTRQFGQRDEGFIVIPLHAPRPAHSPRD